MGTHFKAFATGFNTKKIVQKYNIKLNVYEYFPVIPV